MMAVAFMFESRFLSAPTRFAKETEVLQDDYRDCWRGLKKNFEP
jgi:homogentisate 1,2-dioxygenase